VARTVRSSQLNLTSDRLFSDVMWFLCRFWHIRFVEFGSFRNLIGFFSLLCLYLRQFAEMQCDEFVTLGLA